MQTLLHTNIFWDGKPRKAIEWALESAEKFGFDGIEIESSLHLNPDVLEKAELKEIEDIINSYSAKIILGAHHEGSMCDPNPKIRGKRIGWIEKVMDEAARLGSDIIVTSVDPILSKKYNKEQCFPFLVDSLEKIYRSAAERNIVFTVENDIKHYVGWEQSEFFCNNIVNYPADVRIIAEEIPDVRVTFDQANAYLMGCNPENFLEEIKEYVAHAHLKDVSGKDGNYFCSALGKGGTNPRKWPEILRRYNIPTMTIEFPVNIPGKITYVEPTEFVKDSKQYIGL